VCVLASGGVRGNNSARMRLLSSDPLRPARLVRLARLARLANDGLAWAALLLVAAYLAAAVGPAAATSVERVRAAAAHPRETELAARIRLFGSDFAVSVESIRQALAEGEPYLLVDASEQEESGVYWVRYALAPHAAVYLGRIRSIRPGRPGLPRIEHETLAHLVVANGYSEGPDLYERQEFLDAVAPAPPGHGP
jgi:hypothetical protein